MCWVDNARPEEAAVLGRLTGGNCELMRKHGVSPSLHSVVVINTMADLGGGGGKGFSDLRVLHTGGEKKNKNHSTVSMTYTSYNYFPCLQTDTVLWLLFFCGLQHRIPPSVCCYKYLLL